MTLEPDVARKLRQKIRESGKPATRVYNELLRSALNQPSRTSRKKKTAFNLPVFDGGKGLMAGFSWDMTTAEMLDKLDEEAWKESR